MLQATRRTIAATPTSNASVMTVERIMDALSYVAFFSAAILFAVMVMLGINRLQHKTVITAVQVEGDLRNADRSQIEHIARKAVSGNFFTVNLGDVHQAVTHAPWIDNAVISRRWPNAVRIQVRETQPVALWGGGGLLEARGERFVPVHAVSTKDLPILSGPLNKSVYVMEQYRAMNSVLRTIGMRIVELQLTERMSWFMKLDNGISLVVDQVDAIEKVQRFVYLYERQLKTNASAIASVDLRYRNGIAVGWKTTARFATTAERG